MKDFLYPLAFIWRKHFFYFLLLPLVILNQSCKEDLNWEDDNTYILKGHLYYDCNRVPIANLKIQLKVAHPNGSYNSDLDMTVETTTDSLGYFEFSFKNKRDYPLLITNVQGIITNVIVNNIPAKQSFDNLEVFYSPTTNITVGLNVINSHSNFDTLHIIDFRHDLYLSIPGPFKSGILYTASNFPLGQIDYKGERKCLMWYFNSPTSVLNEQYFTIDKYCSDTILVMADIK